MIIIIYFVILSIILFIALLKSRTRNAYLEYRNKVLTNDLMTFAKLMGDPRLVEEFEIKMRRLTNGRKNGLFNRKYSRNSK